MAARWIFLIANASWRQRGRGSRIGDTSVQKPVRQDWCLSAITTCELQRIFGNKLVCTVRPRTVKTLDDVVPDLLFEQHVIRQRLTMNVLRSDRSGWEQATD